MTVVSTFSVVVALILPIMAILLTPRIWTGRLESIVRSLDEVSERKTFCVGLVMTVTLLLNVAFGGFIHWPTPAVHDEFAYLLTADTFASGRLTNPTPPHWEHFDSYYLLLHPTYQAKYPPAQGAFLALGQVLFGEPIWGVWISLALATGAFCWMLQAWVSPRWALIGGLSFGLNADLMMNWGQTFWGGAVAFLGGALLFGGLRRLVDSPRILDAILLAVGVSLLANSRPYEGLLTSLPAGLVLLTVWGRQRKWKQPGFWLRELTPIAVTLAATAALMLLYNSAVTHNPLRMPYVQWLKKIAGEHAEIADVTLNSVRTSERPTYVIHPMNPDDPVVEELALEERHQMRAYRHTLDFPIAKLWRLYSFFLGPLWTLPLIMLPVVYRDRWGLLAMIEVVLLLCGIVLSTTGGFPHYFAPVAPLLLFLPIAGLNAMEQLAPPLDIQARTYAALVALAVPILFVGNLADHWLDPPYISDKEWVFERQRVEPQLRQVGGDHIVFVRYQRGHSIDLEWVYNSANIEDQTIIWARDLGRSRNRQLIADLQQPRRAWVVVVKGTKAQRFDYEQFFALPIEERRRIDPGSPSGNRQPQEDLSPASSVVAPN